MVRVLAASLALLTAVVVAAGNATRGVCYDTYDIDHIDQHFATIKERFTAVRTFQSIAKGVNVIDAAAKAGLQIAAGVWIRANYTADLQAAIDGARRHPDAVHAIFMGNEDLFHNAMSVETVVAKVHEAKDRLRQAGLAHIKVGSVQMDGDWLRAPALVAACDVVGVNIYAFFGGASISWTNPVMDLDARWKNLVRLYGPDKLTITETGWPHDGGNNGPHISNRENAIAYYQSFVQWTQRGNGGALPYYFMFHDNPSKGGFEANFGLAGVDGRWKFDLAAPFTGPRTFSIVSSHGQSVGALHGGLRAHQAASPPSADDLWQLRGDVLVNQGGQQPCLDVSRNGNNNNQLTVALYPCTANNANQRWRQEASRLVHATYGVCLDVDPTQGNKVQVFACVNDAPNQRFSFV
ncbi:hypothetical protein SPRG_01025 [Saprolegnia parasitica CBS 223.65]|uniref:glucan endo-1,3-beta-D-glucosidase n=1 Tax=Saprolegnia parasitica (strain CBS 223.65) TaxID=695850 RepID=A0A067CWR7_SAPPC|nr:hypothetical protein SPRG_01025 [Saprolegnia parasitica CBS 223.65]KDO34963.1 hypothetical protein SPRG_01025 [Saprolegnia parasitica CBS 223.65]|eukprot:XP_012194617.1 hypothetical protein SPRG_01025 [Saprolegnia parasitica CBS 223.65]